MYLIVVTREPRRKGPEGTTRSVPSLSKKRLRKATLANAHSTISIWVQRDLSMLDLRTCKTGRVCMFPRISTNNGYIK